MAIIDTNLQPNLALQGCSSSFSRERLHFFSGCNGCRPFFYVLINKNACTGFKRFFAAYSPCRQDRKIDEGVGQFMRRLHRVDWDDPRRNLHPTFAVLREPADRITSCFVDRIVRLFGQKGNVHLARSVEKLLAVALPDVTFRKFVVDYALAGDSPQLDPHIRPQSEHLPPGPLRLVALSSLDSYLANLNGFDLLADILRNRYNGLSQLKRFPSSPDETVFNLYQLWNKKALLPSINSLLTMDLREQIMHGFQSDHALAELAWKS